MTIKLMAVSAVTAAVVLITKEPAPATQFLRMAVVSSVAMVHRMI